MKKIIYIVVVLVSGVFTSCTDLSEDVEPNQVEQEFESTVENEDKGDSGGEEDPTPVEDDEED